MSKFKLPVINVFTYSWILLLIFYSLSSKVESLKLDTDGGYSILVGIDSFEAESEPDVENLINSIKGALNDLSSRMYHATQRFYIKNADILLRSHSHLVEIDDDAVSEDYQAADFQISGKVLKPEGVNPNGCGFPGNRLSLPLESFDDSVSIISGKYLLHLFARYRWGVFEEDGRTNDFGRYPHFYRTTREESSWVHTSCSDTPLVGSFETSQGGEPCDITNLDEYPYTCEFVPSPSEPQTASSSLMNYYWLDSINEFCDETTHNILAPNAQNILCRYRSVMEVIRDTQDWGVVSEPIQTDPPETIFKVLGVSQSPRLYLLLDRGRSFAPASVITRVKNKVGNMLQALNAPTVIGIGAYPATTTDSMMDSLVQWSLVDSIKSNITDIIDENFEKGIQGNGNFATALFQLSKSIQATDHPFGTLIVILKTGPPDSFADAPHEYDIIASLNALPVKVYALEIYGNNVMPGLNLENFAIKTGGLHTVINDAISAEEKLDVFVQDIVQQFQTPNIPEKTLAHVYKGYMESGTVYEHDLGATMSTLQVSVTSISSLSSVAISLNGADLPTVESLEWNAGSVEGKREVHYGAITSEITGTVSVSFECESDITCAALLVITGDREDINEEALTSIEITTSSVNNEVDWSETGLNQPFRIYAKVSMPDDSTIENMIGVVCSVNGNTNECQNIPLVDDGLGDPDIMRNDDIYSCTFIPLKDDSYYVRIIVSTSVKVGNGGILREIQSFDLNAIIKFKGVSNFKPTVGRIIDLNVVERSDESITLTWTSPVTYAPGAMGNPAETYELRYTIDEDYIQFINNFENSPQIPDLPTPGNPGEIQRITIDLIDDSEEKFYAIRALYQTNKGEVSNIISSAFRSAATTDPPSTTTEFQTSTDPTTTTEGPTTTTEGPTTTTEGPTTTTEGPTTTTGDPTTTTEDPSTTTEDSSTTNSTSSTEFSSSESSATSSTPQSSTPLSIRSSTTSPSTTPETELFFKKPIGYITAAAGGVAVAALIGGSVAYLCWKRKQLIDAGRLKLV
ncbi:unnamed protein product [Orchesella dallaii]|uniref:Calcium-activated chloride channel N-terminal domain-containing protein n=1 Tax=Orchesella dallaii TaxID=48710 RepID=A0ABP1QW15_9HEXA